jgi:hypothetical protein
MDPLRRRLGVPANYRARHRAPIPATTRRTIRRLALAVCVLAAGGATAAIVGASPSLTNQVAESVSRRPAQFTELYFSAAATVPKQLSTSNPNGFGFTIANHEGRPMVYPYVVTAQSLKGTSIISQNTVTVIPGGLAQETVRFIPQYRATSYLFSVHLSGRAEIIHFVGTS